MAVRVRDIWIAAAAMIIIWLIALGIYGYLSGRWEAEGAPGEQLYQGVPLDEHLLRMDKAALEKAYEQHVLLLFSVWLKDDISIVHRINTGLANGRRAYSAAATRIEERERALRSSPSGRP